MQTLLQKAGRLAPPFLCMGHDSLWSALALWQKQQSKESLEIAPRRITRNSKVKTKPPPKKKETKKTDAETFFWIYCSRTSEVVLAKSPGRPWSYPEMVLSDCYTPSTSLQWIHRTGCTRLTLLGSFFIINQLIFFSSLMAPTITANKLPASSNIFMERLFLRNSKA